MTVASLKKPLWISHRGYKENAVENTAAAFSAAVGMGFSVLETDLRTTRDGHIVLIHDETLLRLANNRRRVRDMTRRELSGFRLANDEPFLFFDRFADWFGSYSWILDVKPGSGKKTIRALAEWVEKNNYSEQLRARAKFVTWTPGHEKLLKSCFAWAECYARQKECWRAGLAVIAGIPSLGSIKSGRTYALTPYFGNIFLYKKSVVRRFHQRSARTVAFLPATDWLAQKAVSAGFDEILTNGKIITEGGPEGERVLGKNISY